MKPTFRKITLSGACALVLLAGAQFGFVGLVAALSVLLLLACAVEAGESDEHLERSMLGQQAQNERGWRRDDEGERLARLLGDDPALLDAVNGETMKEKRM